GLEVPRPGPGIERRRQQPDLAVANERALREAPGSLRHSEPPAAAEEPGDRMHRRALRGPRLRAYRAAAEVQQHRRDVDLHRAHLVAGAAEARRERERGRVLDPDELRREDRSDRSRVDRAVRVAAGARVDRAHVEAGAATNTMQRLPPDLVPQDAR